MDYRNLAEEELKRRIAEQFFPADAGGNRISKIDFTGAKGARPVRSPKGGRPVRATSGQREDHTGGTLCRVAGDPHVTPVQKTVRLILCGGRAACNALYGRIAMHPNNNGRITLRPALRARGPCGRQAGKGKITPAARCAELRAILTLRPYRKPFW